MYRVLHSRPITLKTGEISSQDGETVKYERVVAWFEQGTAHNMEDAKRKFGGAPVLEEIHGVH